ncbi:MAG: hypothetical protein ACO1Q7_02070 [Gemmatimonas sp.]
MTNHTLWDIAQIAIGAVLGALLTIVVQLSLAKRSRFSYTVRHDRIAFAADDAIFGTVRVLWNDRAVSNLYYSVLELHNDSLKDFEKIEVRVFTNNARLLTDTAGLAGSSYAIDWADSYKQRLKVAEGTDATIGQIQAHNSERVYTIPVMNRGQVVKFTYLVEALESSPSIWMDTVHTGVKLRYGASPELFWGVSQGWAVVVGILMSAGIVVTCLRLTDSAVINAWVAFGASAVALNIGALVIKGWRYLRNSVFG